MVKKRKLNEDEVTRNNKAIKRIKGECEFHEYKIEYHQLMVNKGIEQNYKEQLAAHKKTLIDFENQLSVNKEVMKTLQLQIDEGVDPKEVKKDG